MKKFLTPSETWNPLKYNTIPKNNDLSLDYKLYLEELMEAILNYISDKEFDVPLPKNQQFSPKFISDLLIALFEHQNLSSALLSLYPTLLTYDRKWTKLKKEWDFKKNKISPNSLTTGSKTKIWWICLTCGHSFPSPVKRRFAGHGCPACGRQIVSHLNRLTNHPKWETRLKYEWDYDSNDIKPNNVSYASTVKVSWKCKYCNYLWEKKICKRTFNRDCPRCGGKVITEDNRLTNTEIWKTKLKFEWDFEENEINPDQVSKGSDRKYWWICQNHKTKWKTNVRLRALQEQDCKLCGFEKLSESKKNRFKASESFGRVYPELIDEWDTHKNENTPFDISYGSHEKVWWKCELFGHSWETSILSRHKGNKCPNCPRPPNENNRLIDHPQWRKLLKEEWNYDKNIPPENFSYGTGFKVHWICSKCDHKWKTRIGARTIRKTQCIKCVYRNRSIEYKKRGYRPPNKM